ncbi:Gamma-glutamylputrescine oxidoreductase [Hypsizygus marmoreus]|uniref:Gamma-glutamylputrescine oxidoreductase n=1 Tax=Hypsizygus marmoreus TaxID=39966 RepID=A0A369KAV1_HYPMA|nr:Gamma-glutamylputrescine oxidoreductase [Hypsizygus marmoreus]
MGFQYRVALAFILIQSLIMSTLSVPTLQLDTAQAVLELPSRHGPAGLPVANATRSFWIDTPGANPLAKEGSQGELTSDADVCIIGSGITGVSAAYHLAKHFEGREDGGTPVKVVILEARDFCSGATGRNGGHLTPSVFLDFVNRELAYGPDEARKTYALENYTASELINIIEAESLQRAVDFVASSHLSLLVTERELNFAKADFAAAQAAGLDLDHIEWVSGKDMSETYGTSFPASRYPGHNLWPLKLVAELYKIALKTAPSKFSLKLHTNTPVTSITSASSTSRRWSLSTPRGAIQCSYVIHATNGYSSHLLPHLQGPVGIVPTRGQVLALRSASPLSEVTTASWGGNEGFEYWFPRPVESGKEENPLIILGGGREASGPNFEYYVTDDSVVQKTVGKVLRDFLPGVFPGKYEKGREPEMEWTGIMGFTKIGDPFVGPVVKSSELDTREFEGQFIAAGYSGHGMTRAYACAEAVAGMVAAKLTGTKWETPEWLPRHYLTTERP